MERPQEILDGYLQRAITELNGVTDSIDASKVFHELASFCDRQLHYSDSREEFLRVEKLRKQRREEGNLLKQQIKTTKDKTERYRLAKSLDQSRRWLKLDEEEYERLRAERETFTDLSIRNYLQSLKASDKYSDDVLRFLTLWFEFSDMTLVNEAVAQLVDAVPSHKFTPVMNQLTSRLQTGASAFQETLARLVYRVCIDHPYHGMYQIFSGASAQGIKDQSSKSRQEATLQLSQRLQNESGAQSRWNTISYVHGLYDQTAAAGGKNEFATGQELKLEDYPYTREMARRVPKLKIPPITLHINARSDCNYESLPHIHRFRSMMKIAGGLSKPKIITAIGSDGQPYQQLVSFCQRTFYIS